LTKSYIAILSPLAMTASGFVLPYPDLIQGSSASLLNSILIGSAVFVNAIDSKVHQYLLIVRTTPKIAAYPCGIWTHGSLSLHESVP